MSGHEYYSCFQLAASSIITGSQLKFDLTGTFFGCLDTRIRNKICATNANKGAVCSRVTDKCIKELCSPLQLITLAEKDIKSTSNIVNNIMAGGTFYNSTHVNASVAKQHLQANQEMGKINSINQCWGCRHLFPDIVNHSW